MSYSNPNHRITARIVTAVLAVLLFLSACNPTTTTATISPSTNQPVQAAASTTPQPAMTATLTPSITPQPSPTATATYLPRITGNYGVEIPAISAKYGFMQYVDAGITWMRKAGIWWPDVESQEGTYNWDALKSFETEFKAAAGQNVETILIIRGTPAWAQARPGVACGPIHRDKLEAFAQFVSEIVTRYSQPPYNVHYFEIGNEPDIDPSMVPGDSKWGCWGDATDPDYGGGYYAYMLKVVYPAVKAANPDAQVILGGMMMDCNPRVEGGCKDPVPMRFFEGILKAGGKDYFDGVSFHSYDYYYAEVGKYGNPNWGSAWNTTGPVNRSKTIFLRSLLDQYGVEGKYLLNTEGALLCKTCVNDANFETTKAYYLIQYYSVGLADNLLSNIWYGYPGWQNSNILQKNTLPLPGYEALKLMSQILPKPKFLREFSPADGITGYEFDQDGRTIQVLWSRTGENIPMTYSAAPLSITCVGTEGKGITVPSSTNLTIGIAPCFVEIAP